LSIDLGFQSVGWGSLTPGLVAIVKGDDDMASLEMPTIHNDGDVVAYLQIEFTPLLGSSTDSQIEDFGVVFKGETVPATADAMVCLQVGLEPDEEAAIDFWVSPPERVAADEYAGSLTVIASTSPGLGGGVCGS